MSKSAQILDRDMIESHNLPYIHHCIKDIFDPVVADKVTGWLESNSAWKLRESSFYSQNSLEVYVGEKFCADGLNLDIDLKENVIELGEKIFDKKFRRERFEAHAHKFNPGQGIGIHNDWPIGGTESHRIVVHFNREYTDAYGGHLIMYGSESLQDVQAVYRPVYNMALAFPLGRNSWHAVADIKMGVRYSIVFSLWEDMAENLYEEKEWHRNLSILNDTGARQINHSGRSLYDHLVGVAALLDNWGCDIDTIYAGMFHSIYGTQTFHSDEIIVPDFGVLKTAVGARAIRLIHEYPKQKLRELVHDYDSRDLVALLHVHWANIVEQSEHHPMSDDEVQVRIEDYGLTTSLLRPEASNQIDRLLGLGGQLHA